LFPSWEQLIPNVGTSRSQGGNVFYNKYGLVFSVWILGEPALFYSALLGEQFAYAPKGRSAEYSYYRRDDGILDE
jgi:hypothetical protein